MSCACKHSQRREVAESGAPPAQNMSEDVEAEETASFPPLKGGGFSHDIDKEFNSCCRTRICCMEGGCHQPFEPKCQYFCLRLNCSPFKFDIDKDFNQCCQFRLFCMQSGCHEACFEPYFQFFCLRCNCA